MQERARREDELRRREAAWREAEAPLVAELRAAGLSVDSAWDLVNTTAPYPAVLPILLEHLGRPYPDRVREGIARALAVPESSFGADTLLDLYRREPAETDAKQGLAVASATAAASGPTSSSSSPATRPTAPAACCCWARCRAPALEPFAADPELGEEARRAPSPPPLTGRVERRASRRVGPTACAHPATASRPETTTSERSCMTQRNES